MYSVDIAAAARSTDAFRRVLHTAPHVQLVVMSLRPGEDIGTEVHEHNDQVLTFVEGTARADVAGEARNVRAGDIVVVPAGTRHNFTNIGDTVLRLYTLYAHLTTRPAPCTRRRPMRRRQSTRTSHSS